MTNFMNAAHKKSEKNSFGSLKLLCCLMLIGTLFATNVQVLAQTQKKLYDKAIDDINCTVIKLLLVSYDRPALARNISNCTHANIVKEVRKVRENQVRGYRDMFLKLSNEINGYKTSVAGNSVSDYANSLEEASGYALSQFRKICQTHQAPNNKVCFRLEQKVLTLESDFNNIVSETIGKMGGQTRPNEPPPNQPAARPQTNHTTDNDSPPAAAAENDTPIFQSVPQKSTRISLLVAFVLIALIAAVAWLFKEVMDLKEELADLKLLLKTLTQRKE